MIKKIKKNHSLLALILIFIFFFSPALFEPLSYGDECIYLTLGNAFRKGLVFYRDIHDNKPPLIYLIASLSGGRLFWFRTIAMLWNLVHLLIIYRLIKFLTKNNFLSFLGGVIFSSLLIIFEGRIANGETFMMMPVSLAVFLLLTQKKNNKFSFALLIGFLFSLGFLFKIPVAFDFAGIILAFFFLKIPSFSRKNIEKILFSPQLKGVTVGFILPIITSVIYYAFKGGVVPYVRSALMQNIGYLSSWQGNNLGLIIRFFFLLTLTLLVFFLRKKFSFISAFSFLWFIFALFGALLSGRPYPHYLVEIIPSFTLLFIILLQKIKERKRSQGELLFLFSASILLVAAYFHFHFWWYPQLPYYRNFFSYLLGRKTEKEYFSFWGKRTLANYRLAKFIRESTSPEERIFVWGDAACIYALSQRLPPGRYTVNYHIFDFNGFKETMTSIKKKKPRLIIKLKEEKRDWPELNSYLEQSYFPFSLPQVEDKLFIRRSQQAEKW